MSCPGLCSVSGGPGLAKRDSFLVRIDPDVLAAMRADADLDIRELRVDGGATANNLLMQFQAALLGLPVVRPRVAETTALGAAYFAGLAVGFWKDLQTLQTHWHMDCDFKPDMRRGDAERMLERWHAALDRAKGWAKGEE